MIEPLYRRTWDAQRLCLEHPARFQLPNKVAVLAATCPDGYQSGGQITTARWPTMVPEPSGLADRHAVRPVPGGYPYRQTDENTVDWWVNFAAGELFQFYHGRCFAQDEIQVFEHPVLACVREALLAEGLSVRVTDTDAPTPFTIVGAERRLEFDTSPHPERGVFYGLYGRKFAAAPTKVLLEAGKPVVPPTTSHVLAMEAPAYGTGPFQRHEIGFAFAAAYTAFRAAVIESNRINPTGTCVIHTGFWGCGAYGGDHVMMTAIQSIAAAWAGVTRLHDYLWDDAGEARFVAGESLAQEVERSTPERTAAAAVERLVMAGRCWRESDGN